MRRYLLPIVRRLTTLVVLLTFVGVQVIPLSALARKPGKRGFLELFSTTVGAELRIDGKLRGIVPLDGKIGLKPGKHSIEVRLRGYLSHEETIKIRHGRTTELEVDLIAVDGIVSITTPGLIDATIRVDGEIIGSTPFDGSIPAGDHALEISREGYASEVRELRIQAGKLYRIDVRLDAVRESQTATALQLDFTTKAPETSTSSAPQVGSSDPFYETWWFWTLTGVALTGAATGVVFAVGIETEIEAPFDHRIVLP
jgi:hypothetical protein